VSRTAGILKIDERRLGEDFQHVVRAMLLEGTQGTGTQLADYDPDPRQGSLVRWLGTSNTPRFVMGLMVGAVLTVSPGVEHERVSTRGLNVSDLLSYVPDQNWFRQELAFWGAVDSGDFNALYSEFEATFADAAANLFQPIDEEQIREWASELTHSVSG